MSITGTSTSRRLVCSWPNTLRTLLTNLSNISTSPYSFIHFSSVLQDLQDSSVFLPLSPHFHTGFFDVLVMLLQGIVFLVVCIFLDSGLVYRMWGLVQRDESDGDFLAPHDTTIQPDVRLEENLVNKLYKENRMESQALVVRHLSKAYGLFHPSIAVDGISFSLNKMECFGLIGVSGTGKTTVLRLLAVEQLLTTGEAYMRDLTLTRHAVHWQRMVGYVPARWGLVNTLTGRENIYLFALLRGVHDSRFVVESLLDFVDVTAPDQLVSRYSAGAKTLLSLAMAIIGLPSLLLLDLADMDVASRLNISKVIEVLKYQAKLSVLLTCDRLDYYNLICDRLAIMVAGRIECIGSLEHLRQTYGRGFTISVHTFPDRKLDLEYQKLIAIEIIESFPNSTLARCYNGVLEFRIEDASLGWFVMFDRMQTIKRKFKFHEFYASDTTLEQIFISLARKHAGLQPRTIPM